MKQKLKTYLKIGILAFGMTFVVTSCTTDALDRSSDTLASETEFDKFKQGFNSKHINEELLLGENNFQVDWNSSNIIGFSKSENKTVYEFDAYLNNPITTESEIFNTKNVYKLIVTNKDNQIQYKIVRFEPFIESNNITPSYKNINDFSGNKYQLNLLGRIEQLDTYQNGEIIASLNLTEKSSNNSSLLSKLPSACDLTSFTCGSSGGGSSSGGAGGSYRRQTTYHYTDWYRRVGNSWQYTHTKYNGRSTKWVYVRNNSGGYTSHNVYTHHGPNRGPNIEPARIINNFTGKARCLNKLLSEKGTDYVKNILEKFKGESEFDIKLVSKDKVTSVDENGNVIEVNGTTSSPVNNWMTISISTSKVNQHSALDAARTILHEYIHADIYRKLLTKYPTAGELDFRTTYQAYESQHEAMGALYISSMRDALKHFHKNVLTDDYNKYTTYWEEEPSDDFYEALAWRGLKEHDVDAWTNLSPERQEEIENLSSRVEGLTLTITCPD